MYHKGWFIDKSGVGGWGNLRHDTRYGVKHDSSQNAMRRTAEPKDSLVRYRLGDTEGMRLT